MAGGAHFVAYPAVVHVCLRVRTSWAAKHFPGGANALPRAAVIDVERTKGAAFPAVMVVRLRVRTARGPKDLGAAELFAGNGAAALPRAAHFG